jgi:chromosomal replication initiator protein
MEKVDEIKIHDVIKLVCDKWSITERELKGPSRINLYVQARADAAHILRKQFGLSYHSIARVMGGKDHTTIMHYFNAVDKRVDKSKVRK